MLPAAEDLPELLLDLSVPHEDINELVRLHRTVTGDAGVLRLLEECVEDLVRDIGLPGRPVRPAERLAEAPAHAGAYFLAYVFLGAVPHVRAYHRDRGIPADVSRHTLADLGRAMAVYRRQHGHGGVQASDWLVRHFRGTLYQLGRLQFERTALGDQAACWITESGHPVSPGDPVLALHVPDFSGPLTPAACDRSLARAREFFARYFAEERHRIAVCHSWLLDPQLRRYLPADSNIVRFQQRFRPTHEDTEPSDADPVRFVFGDPDLPVDDLPRRTSVERAVVDHLRAGGHWYLGHGWCALNAGPPLA
ncbi:acyltransferase domain-containing protein [Streptomyces sp. NPDC006012]|uniref:acyltransferase domain-containing protein n=1 Tax=Streptomyces sp. NPDC006012 TaxID=3364739 RepID=UPI003695CFF9